MEEISKAKLLAFDSIWLENQGYGGVAAKHGITLTRPPFVSHLTITEHYTPLILLQPYQ